MDVDALIDAYVHDVVRRLPRKQRDDVALELRDLLGDDLHSRAAAEGRALDTQIALESLRNFGRPQDIAARYCEPWVIIPQTETRSFTFAAIVGAAVLVALSVTSDTPAREGELGIALLAWLGALVAYFGVRGFVERRMAAHSAWTPHDRDAAGRAGSIALVALICLGIVAYGEPAWLFAQVTHGGKLAASLAYDPTFKASRLPLLFALWGCQALLLTVLATRGRWNALLRRIDLGIEIAIGSTLVWFVAAGNVFQDAALNHAAVSAIGVFALLVFIDAGVKIYRGTSGIPPHRELKPIEG
jgi:hypothetical protein